jgi:hypothetical protein
MKASYSCLMKDKSQMNDFWSLLMICFHLVKLQICLPVKTKMLSLTILGQQLRVLELLTIKITAGLTSFRELERTCICAYVSHQLEKPSEVDQESSQL